MTFLEAFHASRGHDGDDHASRPLALVRDWILERPAALFAELLERQPTLHAGRLAFVSRMADVADVLQRSDVFSVAPYGEAITRINRGPNFLLGMDDGPEYQAQLSLLHRAVPRDDGQRTRQQVRDHAQQAIGAAAAAQRIDLTDGYGRLVPAGFVGDYFGIPGPDPATLADWARHIFLDGFANVLNLPLLSRRAMRASEDFRAHLDQHIARVRADRAGGGAPQDDVLGRLLTLEAAGDPGFGAAQPRDLLLWCVSGMIDNVNTAVCTVIDHLLDHDDRLEGATAAARAGDDPLLLAYVLEALRFRTPTPVVTRRSLTPYTLSAGTPHETTIPEGTLTFAGLGAAMMDDTAVEAPREFRLHRPRAHYLHFGAGLHHCLGRHLAETLVVEMSAQVLQLDGLRRASGVSGRLRFRGAFPKRFNVQFSRRSAA